MPKPVAPDRCPVCPGGMLITALKCGQCGTKIEGEFSFPAFFSLSVEDLGFLEIFVKNSGSLKDVQAELSLSYPTVKKQLDRIIAVMGYAIPAKEENRIGSLETGTILDQLRRGEITTQEAITRIEQS